MIVMYVDFYEKVSQPWRRAGAEALLARIDAICRVAFAAAYAAILVWLAFTGDGRLPKAFLVPLATFCLVTVARAAIDAKRPYEMYPISPLVPKGTHGRSMPSRHMASATIIALTALWATGPAWGALGIAGCLVVAYARIAGGVHFPRDIAAAAIVACACAVVGYVVIP